MWYKEQVRLPSKEQFYSLQLDGHAVGCQESMSSHEHFFFLYGSPTAVHKITEIMTCVKHY